ncbi:CHAT domain-containing protein [Streptomyces sp. AC536]|uniref:CHAT domain-containing protein n=1 Tax=Streptomyces buecherae TaxID=2763006 RepID=UPI00164E78D7|nr:CHAT domain-containing protein [Streptomyces buecherae]MBC3984600.1 CHAT domain-containing protein [Streptomyces buecherae]QNJ39517.1 CHAT domain-containing protein [Streptomyces buecherae]
MSEETAWAHAMAAEVAYFDYCETSDPELLSRATEEFEEAFEDPGSDGTWAVWRIMLGHLRCVQYEEAPAAPLLRHARNLLSAGLAALPDDDGEGSEDRTLAYVLLALVARLRYERSKGRRGVEERRALLDEAIQRHIDAEPWARPPDEDPSGEIGTLLALRRAQAYLLLERYEFTTDVRDAERAVDYSQEALNLSPPAEQLPLCWYGLGLALFVRGTVAQDRALLDATRDAFQTAFAVAGAAGMSTEPWVWEAEIRLAAVHGYIWLKWKDQNHGHQAMADVGRLLAEPGAEERLESLFLSVFASVLFEKAGREADSEGQDRAIAMARRLVRETLSDWGVERSRRLLLLAGFQKMRYYQDPDPERVREAGRAAVSAQVGELSGAEMPLLAQSIHAWARIELARRGLLTPDDETALPAFSAASVKDMATRLLDDVQRGNSRPYMGDTAPDFPGTSAGTSGRQRLASEFAAGYELWCGMEVGSRERGRMAAGLLTVMTMDVDVAVVSEELRDTLLGAMLETDKEDPEWQRHAHKVAGLVMLRYEQQGRGRGMDEVAAHLARANGEGSATDYTDLLLGSEARQYRGQADGARDELEAAAEMWRRLRDEHGLSPRIALLAEAEQLTHEVREAAQQGDLVAVDQCITRVAAIRAELEADHPSRAELWVRLTHMSVRREALAEALGRPYRQLPDAPTIGELRRDSLTLPRSHRALILGDSGAGRLHHAWRNRDTRALTEGLGAIREARELSEPGNDGYLRYTALLAHAHYLSAGLLRDPRTCGEHLDSAIDLFEESFVGIGEPERQLYASTAMGLARARYERASRRPLGSSRDRARALTVGLQGLRGYAWAALLQSATSHAAQAAAEATAHALEVASWALRQGALEPAVEALEACRGLTLHAVITTKTVPHRLVAAGLDELAGEWSAAGIDSGNSGPFESAGTREAPSALRRRVLTALRAGATEPGDRLLDPPDVAAIGEALRALGRDALVYLVPESDGGSGTAVLVTSTDDVHALPLPGLTEQAGPLAEYAPVPSSARDMGPIPGGTGTLGGDPAVSSPSGRPELRRQLDRLCGWAWYVAMRPLLDVFAAPDRPNRVPRLVLVPMGRLGLVPWHAAYHVVARGRRRYALQDADLSYAASARLLCEVAARPAAARTEGALIVGDPVGDLVYAGEEADAIQRLFYPHGTFLGRRGSGVRDGAGTPAEVLDWLRGTESTDGVLHLACHASVTHHARRSAGLALSGGTLFAEDLTGTADAMSSGGPALVLLAACRSHVSGHGDNEAFTLATAFLVAGARSAVGSLWPVPDEATSGLMLLTHHFLCREHESPARALRRAQLWLLGLERRSVGGLPAELTARAARVDPDDLSAWAGFVHLGR